MRRFSFFFIIILLVGGAVACQKQTADVPISPLSDYYPLHKGNSYTYRLDSTVYLAFGTSIATKSYLAKDSIVDTYSDNANRTVYLFYRYLTDTTGQQPFGYHSAFFVVPTGNTIEVTDANNLRFISLAQPVTPTASWLGNSYIDTKSLTSELGYMDNWRYTYQSIHTPFSTLHGTFDSTITVLGIDETRPDDSPFDPRFFKQRDYAAEVYAKGVGLIYKEFTHWVWQPSGGIGGGYYEDGSYGIKMNLLAYSLHE